MDLSKYKYKTSFSAEIKLLNPSKEDESLAVASLTNARQYFPADIDPESTPDLLYICMSAFNGGVCNRNGHGVRKEDAIAIAKKFKNKYIDLEHNRSHIIGNLLGYGFTKHGQSESITEDEAMEHDGPIDVILSGYVWITANESVANLILDSADPKSAHFNSCSASWEILYSDYDIGIGSRYIHEAKIITDPDEKANYSKYLRDNGGKGYDENGNQIYAIFSGDCLPVGLGVVGQPAAIVEGVTPLGNEDHPDDCECEDCKAAKASIIIAANNFSISGKEIGESLQKILTNYNEILSELKKNTDIQLEKNKNSVNTVTILENKTNKKNMKYKFEDLTKEVLESNASAAEVFEVAKELNVKMTKYAEDLQSKETEVLSTQEKFDKLKTDHDSILAELDKVKKDLDTINETRAAEKTQNDFTARMSDLNEKFELDEDKSKIIAKKIRGLSDEDYASWLEDQKAFLVEKKVSAPDATASLISVIQNLQPSSAKIVNKLSTKESIDEAFGSAFGDLFKDSKKEENKK